MHALTGGPCINFIQLPSLSLPAVVSVVTVTRLAHFCDIYGRQKSHPAWPILGGFATGCSRDGNLAARGSGRLFRLFIGTVCAKRRRRVPLPLRSTSFPFSGRTPNGSDTLTPMDLFLVRRPGIRANASTILTLSSGSLTYERLHTHAWLQAYALRRRDYVHLSRITHRIYGHSRIHSHNVNRSVLSVQSVL